jgi:cellulose synthase/poly-beta-1,6-N-acetylglucosamine synthase-like glycosyltransferase
MIVLTIASALVVALWGLFTALLPRALRFIPRLSADERPRGAPRVSIVIPARNEVSLLPRCLETIQTQTLAPHQVIVVDDHSSDGTGQAAARFKGVEVVVPGERPAGWAGKCWALWTGAERATGDWLLLVDADMMLEPECLAAAVGYAERTGAGLLSLMPLQAASTRFEAVVQPVMLLLTGWSKNPRRVNDPADGQAAASGGFLLFRSEVYRELGGHSAPSVHGSVVEDMQLARLVKGAGRGLQFISGVVLLASARPQTPESLWTSWCRVTVDGLDRRARVGLAGALAVAVLFLLPYLAAPFSLWNLGLAAIHLGLVIVARGQLAGVYGLDDRMAWLQPAGALFALSVLLRSALLSWAGGSVRWSGRDYKKSGTGS